MLKKEFDTWWNGDDLTYDNPFEPLTPAYWAWEGWIAGIKAEREACAKVCDEYDKDNPFEDVRKWRNQDVARQCAINIRARSDK
jgi:hypothetical protein